LTAFLVLTFVVLALPFAPALVEWRRRTDAEPLHVEHESTVSARHFALTFRDLIGAHVQKEIDACRADGRISEIVLPERERCLVVPRSDSLHAGDDLPDSRELDTMVAACGDLQLPWRALYSREIYSPGSVYAGKDVTCRAVLAEEDLLLGDRATILRWAHAGGELRVGREAMLYGRLTADREMLFEGRATFERLNAPRIAFGMEPVERTPPPSKPREPWKAEDLGRSVEVDGSRWLVRGDARIPEKAYLRSDVVVMGAARIGRNARIEGSVKSHGLLHLEVDVVVVGSVVSEGSVVLSPGCRVLGPILAEETIYLHPGAVAGTPDKPTTVSAWRILAALGSVCHGTVWARREGRIVDSAADFPV